MENIIFVPDLKINDSLKVVLENYEGVNTARCTRQGRMILSALKGLCLDVEKIITENFPEAEIRMNNMRPTTFWPDVPWTVFDGSFRHMTDRGPFLINMSYQFAADMSGVFFALSVNADGWRERFGSEWPSKFEPFKLRLREDLVWLRDYGFQLDDDANLMSDDSFAEDMQHSYIAYKFYSIVEMPSEKEIQRDLVIIFKAQQQLISKE
ncbi:MAG: DUF3578 domain-containing protein [Euryarchaeota archaeon]|nr:DUF3578 domain-containing protein [Euryarchaeota archaeon]